VSAGGLLILVDVGNTNTVFGVQRGKELIEAFRLSSDHERTADEYGALVLPLFQRQGLDPLDAEAVVISSVVPPLHATLERLARKFFGKPPLWIEPGVRTGMPIRYDNPAEVGADRIVNAVAAYEKFGKTHGAPLPMVVVDFGTATTLDAVSAKGEYLGGAICPGVTISADALFQRAARLPRIDVRKPSNVIGRTTVMAMESGLFYGYVGMVEGLVRRMNAELGGNAKCVATGGLAAVIAPETQLIDAVDIDLTLHGLRIVWGRNQR
jgi:type III pantothenate kinase